MLTALLGCLVENAELKKKFYRTTSCSALLGCLVENAELKKKFYDILFYAGL